MGQMDTLRRATNLTAIRASDAQLDGSRVLLRSDGQVEDFMDTYTKPTTADKVMCWYALGALIAALGVGVLGYVGSRDISRALQLASVSLLAAAPATGFICQSRPKAVLEKRLRTVGTVLCGWDGVKAAKGKVIFPVKHTDLFPAGCAKMNGVKFFGQRSTDQIVAYATALIHAADGGLAPLFKQVLESRNCRLLGVENLRHYDDGGIGGEVMDEPVLMGTLSFLRSMGVEVPEGLRVTQAVCVSIDGELCGLFAITYEKNRDAFLGLTALNNYRGVTPILNVLDHLLTPGFLRAKFGIQPKRLLFADEPVRQQLAGLSCREDAPAIALTTRPGLASLAYGVTGARALHTACWLGAILQIVGGVVGIGMMVALVLLEGAALLTPANIFLLQLVWIIPSLLITEWSRAI